MLEVVALAGLLVHQLKPFLPVVIGIAQGAEKKLGEEAVTWAQRVWTRLTNRDRTTTNDDLEQAARDAAQHPDDEDVIGAFRLCLRRAIETDPALRADLDALVSQAPGVEASGQRTVAINGAVSQSTIITGDRNTVR